MLLYQRANPADQKQKPKEIDMYATTSQFETIWLKSHLLSENVEPSGA